MAPEDVELLQGDVHDDGETYSFNAHPHRHVRHRGSRNCLWERTLRISAVASVLLLVMALAGQHSSASSQRAVTGSDRDVVELPAVRALDGIGTLVNHETGMCLDWGNIIVDVIKCFPHRKQQLFEYDPFGQRLVTQEGHGTRKPRCLDSGGKYLHVWECAGDRASPKQQWHFDGEKGIVSQGSGPHAKCLAAAKKALWLQPCANGGHSQLWHLQRPQVTGDEPLPASKKTTSTTTTVTTPTSKTSTTTTTPKATTTTTSSTATTLTSTVTVTSTRTATSTSTSTVSMTEVVKVIHFPNVCLTISSDESLHIDTCHASNRRQHWEHNFALGTFKGATGHCLDASKEGLLGACEDARATQAWGVHRDSGQILTEGGLCLDATLPRRNYSAVRLHPCRNDHMGQKWYMQLV